MANSLLCLQFPIREEDNHKRFLALIPMSLVASDTLGNGPGARADSVPGIPEDRRWHSGGVPNRSGLPGGPYSIPCVSTNRR